jgi:hypothetical protein
MSTIGCAIYVVKNLTVLHDNQGYHESRITTLEHSVKELRHTVYKEPLSGSYAIIMAK